MGLVAKLRWKEELTIVDEQGRSFMFDCGWGVDPPVAYVPLAEQWTACVPAWLHECDEVIAAMKAVNHQVLDSRDPELQDPDLVRAVARAGERRASRRQRRFEDSFRATAARTRAFSAWASIFSPSRTSMARLTLPSRLELKRRDGSFSEAPLAKVSFTTLL